MIKANRSSLMNLLGNQIVGSPIVCNKALVDLQEVLAAHEINAIEGGRFDIRMIMIDAFNLGKIYGKREDRAKRNPYRKDYTRLFEKAHRTADEAERERLITIATFLATADKETFNAFITETGYNKNIPAEAFPGVAEWITKHEGTIVKAHKKA